MYLIYLLGILIVPVYLYFQFYPVFTSFDASEFNFRWFNFYGVLFLLGPIFHRVKLPDPPLLYEFNVIYFLYPFRLRLHWSIPDQTTQCQTRGVINKRQELQSALVKTISTSSWSDQCWYPISARMSGYFTALITYRQWQERRIRLCIHSINEKWSNQWLFYEHNNTTEYENQTQTWI